MENISKFFPREILEDVLLEYYGTVDIDCLRRLYELLSQSDTVISLNAQFELQRSKDDFESRKLALEAAVKTYGQTGGDLTENAIKYKRFLLNETVNEN
jgi:hypothetical protein